MISWGTFLLCNVAAKNKGGIYATRFLLGAVGLTFGGGQGNRLTWHRLRLANSPVSSFK
jgi:hypothetical protein